LRNRVSDQQWMLMEWHRVPRPSAIAWAISAHVAALALTFLFWRAERVRIVPQESKMSSVVSGPLYLDSNASNPHASPSPGQARLHRRTKTVQLSPTASIAQGGSEQALHQQATQETAEIMKDLKFRQIYGFSLKHAYQLPMHSTGELPYISAHEVPPHFEQYVVVEVTIGVDGRVSEAHILAGIVPSTIQHKLLSAIREFKYNPATRDGVPIPSELDIVVHVPS
jgi:hypothetical protein